MKDRRRWIAAAALGLGVCLVPQAEARVGFYFGVAPGVYFGPPAYYYAPPPVYYYVPPSFPTPYPSPSYGYVPPYNPPLAGPGNRPLSCRAGEWSCPPAGQSRPGDACSCATARGAVWGRVTN